MTVVGWGLYCSHNTHTRKVLRVEEPVLPFRRMVNSVFATKPHSGVCVCVCVHLPRCLVVIYRKGAILGLCCPISITLIIHLSFKFMNLFCAQSLRHVVILLYGKLFLDVSLTVTLFQFLTIPSCVCVCVCVCATNKLFFSPLTYDCFLNLQYFPG